MPVSKAKAIRPTRERGASRELILEAASDEFARHGFAGARIDAIALRTQLNVRMIYYHFRSKEGLYQAVLEAIYRNMSTVLDAPGEDSAGAGTGTSAQGAVAAFGRYVDLLSRNPRFADILIREAIDGAERLGQLFKVHPELYESLHVRAHRLLETSIENGTLRKVDPALAVHSLTGMVCLLTAARSAQALFLGGRTVEPSLWKATLVDLFLHGLAPAAPGAR